MITYAFTDGEFSRTFQHLYNRICNLRDSLIGYFAEENVHALVPVGYEAEGVPAFLEVSFDEPSARQYEKTMQKFFSHRPRGVTTLPKPQFAVTLKLDFYYGVTGVRTFDFTDYCEESLVAFCSEIRKSALEVFHHRFSSSRKTTI